MAALGQTGYPQEKDVIPDVTGKPLGGNTDPNADHSNVHDRTSQATVALEDKAGYDLDGLPQTPTSGKFLKGTTTAGGSAWLDGPSIGASVVTNSTYSRSPIIGIGPQVSGFDHDHGNPGRFREANFTFDTVSSPTIGTYKYRVKRSATLIGIRCCLGTVGSTGLSVQVDLRKNGVTMISSSKPTITVGQAINTNVTTFSTLDLIADDLLSVNIDQGSSGAQLSVIVELEDKVP
jgi:hypothetical protein